MPQPPPAMSMVTATASWWSVLRGTPPTKKRRGARTSTMGPAAERPRTTPEDRDAVQPGSASVLASVLVEIWSTPSISTAPAGDVNGDGYSDIVDVDDD